MYASTWICTKTENVPPVENGQPISDSKRSNSVEDLKI